MRSANAAIINISPSKDNTLYEYDPLDGDTSNALGFHFFAGETAMGELRRGVIAFDIAGHIPPGSTIIAVTLSLNMSRTPLDDPRTVELHKLLADWGEGTSMAPGEEGDGAPSTPNETPFSGLTKEAIFPPRSALASRSALSEQYTWSSAQMVADVQSWLDNQASNFGWLVLGDESTILASKRFDTRESASPPVLTVQYISGPRILPTPRPCPTLAPRP